MRFNQERMRRIHQSDTKIMVVEKADRPPTPIESVSVKSSESEYDYTEIDL